MNFHFIIGSKIFLLQLISTQIVFGVLSNFSTGLVNYSKISEAVGLSAGGALLALFLKKSLLKINLNQQIQAVSFLMIFLIFFSGENPIWKLFYVLLNTFLHLIISKVQGEIGSIKTESIAELNKAYHLGNTSGSLVGVTMSPLIGLNYDTSYIFMISFFLFILYSLLSHYSYKTNGKILVHSQDTISNECQSKFIPTLTTATLSPHHTFIYIFTLLIWMSGGFFYVVEIPILKSRFNFDSSEIALTFFLTTAASLVAIFISKKIHIRLNMIFLGYFSLFCLFFAYLYAVNYVLYFVFPVVLLYGFFNGSFNFTYSYLLQKEQNFQDRMSSFLMVRVIAQIGLLVSSLLSSRSDGDFVLNILFLLFVLGGIVLIFFHSFNFVRFFIIIPILLLSTHQSHAKMAQLKVMVSSIPQILNPANVRDTSSAMIHNHIYERLYSLDQQNFIVPVLVKQSIWSPDLKKLTLHLKNKKYFSDGTVVTARDVLNSLSQAIRILGEDSRWAFGNLVGFDEYLQNKNLTQPSGLYSNSELTLIIEFKEATPYFIKILTAPYFSIYRKVNDQNLGSGPYKFKEKTDDSIELLSNPKYGLLENQPQKIIFTKKVSNDEDLNFTNQTENKNLVSKEFNYLQSISLIFNTTHPYFKNSTNRCAFGKEAFLAFNSSKYNFVPIHIGLPIIWSIQKAANSISAENLNFFKNKTIQISYANSTAYFEEKNHLEIIEKLNKVGVQIRFKKMEVHELLESFKKNNFEVALMGFVPDYLHPDALLTPFLGTNQQYNFSKYSSYKLDKILDEAKATNNTQKQLRLYNKAFDILNSDCPIVFLGSQPGRYHHKKNISAPDFSSLGFHNIELQKIKGE